ncbi:MAG: hypothetical protein AVDCRST_MAG25-1796, partial [uncultured Rubrobacteraceae bacterium]
SRRGPSSSSSRFASASSLALVPLAPAWSSYSPINLSDASRTSRSPGCKRWGTSLPRWRRAMTCSPRST